MKTSEIHEVRPERRGLKLLGLIAVVLAGAGLYAKHRGAPTRAARAVASSDALSEVPTAPALNRRMDNADLRLRLLSAQVAALSSSASAPAVAASPAPTAEREERATPLETPTNLADLHERQGALLNQTIEHGPRDDWSRTKQLELTTTLSEMLRTHADLNLTVDAVDCVATLCRLRLAPQGEFDPRSVLGTLTTQMTWPGERYYKVVPGDPPSVTIFAAREGSELPRVAMADPADTPE